MSEKNGSPSQRMRCFIDKLMNAYLDYESVVKLDSIDVNRELITFARKVLPLLADPELEPIVAGVVSLEARRDAIKVDGWDLGILIRLERYNGFHSLDWISGELASECGWLSGGEAELFTRVVKLLSLGCVEFRSVNPAIPTFRFVKYPEGVAVR